MKNFVLEQCSGFQTNQLLVLFGLGIFGGFTNLVTLGFLKKNFNLNKPINQVLLMDLSINIIGILELLVH